MTDKPKLIPGYEKHQARNNREEAAPGRWDYPLKACRFLMEDTARRVEESRALFPHTFYRGDCHSHTDHSDGIGTVAETADSVKAAGLDFQFVTDHWGVTQAPECIEHGLWYGQEPTTKHHHMGILGLDYAFAPKQDFLADYAEASALGATVFIPHPTGWWPVTVYPEESLRILEELPSTFLMEICNGANNIVDAFDYTDASALQLWDHLLYLGRHVHAMGNTDAHLPHAIGMVWNSVFAPACEQAAVIAELRQGHSFVSSAPLIHIALGEARMGDIAGAGDRTGKLEIHAVDSRGISSVRVVADGEVIYDDQFGGDTQARVALKIPAGVTRYIRAEAHSVDAKHAYSNPIYWD